MERWGGTLNWCYPVRSQSEQIRSLWHTGKRKSTEPVKLSVQDIEREGGEKGDRLTNGAQIFVKWNYCVWCYGYSCLPWCICQSLLIWTTQSEPHCKLWTWLIIAYQYWCGIYNQCVAQWKTQEKLRGGRGAIWELCFLLDFPVNLKLLQKVKSNFFKGRRNKNLLR